MTNGIRLIASDIDGVITDGHLTIDMRGNEQKRISFRDLDAVTNARRFGIDLIFITGEDNGFVDIISKRFGEIHAFKGRKDKLSVLTKYCVEIGLDKSEICYIGDSDYDISAISWAGIGVAPSDATLGARTAANYITECSGGNGVIYEVVVNLLGIY